MKVVGKILLVLIGFVLLLPGLRGLVFISSAVSDSGGLMRSLRDMRVLWSVGFLVSALDAKLIYVAFRNSP